MTNGRIPLGASPASSITRDAACARRRPRRRFALIGGVGVVALLFPAAAHPPLRLVWNVSASVPLGLYRIDPGKPVRVGELAAVRPSPPLARLMAERHYVELGALLIKPVAGEEGATFCRHRDTVRLNGRVVAVALDADRFRRPLPRWSGCRTLSPGQLVLLAPKVRASFDSRYFGPVKATDIVGRAVPLWVRS